ncbi:MAG TPA: ABC transporter substrate-binding protein [Candidatus Paceibacterota bacterium]|nr:ABC transporter substrate-binding protein [Candidatus Paceibacterota bacterium]HMO83152.1 ABC transporter substrate-binding protein [Candidatus Paceibacterota bacterium]
MKLRPFELALVAVFGTLFLLALVLLSSYSPKVDPNVSSLAAGVSIWGTIPETAFFEVLAEIGNTDPNYKNVSYRYISPENFDNVFINALADQAAPDLLFLSHEKLIEHRKRLQTISYNSFPMRDFRNLYIDGAEIFALSDGIYALPVAVDPLLMYWNRDIFADNGLLKAPTTWEEIVNQIVPTFTLKDNNRNITRPAIAMGEYSNIKNAFPILSLLLLQGGSSLVGEGGGYYQVRLNESVGQASANPFTNMATFFTNFSNINNTLYSWNRALRLDTEMFLSEDLPIYFGFASEGRSLAARNPNLSFDVGEVPQGASASIKRNYGIFYGLAIPKAAKNKTGAAVVLQTLSSEGHAQKLADLSGFAPTHRTALSYGSNDIFGRVAYASAIYSRGWLNPDRDRLDTVLQQMLSSITANRNNISSATLDAITRISQIY